MVGNKFAVLGVGKYGTSIARTLANKGAEVYAFDISEVKINNIKDQVALAVKLDTTDQKALLSQNINQVDAAVVAIGENFEAVILTTAHLIDIGVKRVITRASGKQQRLILEKIGVTEILSPEDEVATAVTEKLINPSIVSFLELPDDHEVAEIIAPKAIINRTIEDINMRKKYNLTLITIKREFGEKKEQHVLGVPKSDTTIEATDTVVVFGTSKDIARFIEINE